MMSSTRLITKDSRMWFWSGTASLARSSPASDRMPERIGTLLFLDAARPAKVRTPQGAMADDYVMKEVRRRGDGWRFLITDEVMDGIGSDLVGKDRDWFLSKTTPWPLKMIQDTVTLSGRYDEVRKAYIFCTRGGDNVEEIMKEKLDGRTESSNRATGR